MVLRGLLLGGLALGPGGAWATDATLWLAGGVSEERAIEAASLLGHDDPAVRPVGELARAITVIGVIDRRIQDLCGGPVSVDDWRGRLEDGRAQLQLLDLQAALTAFGLLEAELPCLTGLLSPGDVFRFHLAAAEVQLVAAQSQTEPSLVSFYQGEAELAARRAAAAGPYLSVPDDTLIEARQLLTAVRAELAAQAPARVVVAGPQERVWWNGTAADRVAFDVPPGTHVFQLTDGTRQVVAVELAELPPGGAAVVWARPDATPLSTDDVLAAARTLAETGRSPIGLAQSLRALSADGPSYVVTGDDERVRLWGADGDRVRLRLVDPPEGSSAADPREGGTRRSSGGGDFGVHLGFGGGAMGPTLTPLLGVDFGLRVGLHRMLVLTVSTELAAQGDLSDPERTDAGRFAAVGGLRYRLTSGLWDVGAEGGIGTPIGQVTSGGASPLVRGVTSLRLPPETLGAVRLAGHGGWHPASPGALDWIVGGGLLFELGGAVQ